jgi:hypothetical protein
MCFLGDIEVGFGDEGHYDVFIGALEGGHKVFDWPLGERVDKSGLTKVGFGNGANCSGLLAPCGM